MYDKQIDINAILLIMLTVGVNVFNKFSEPSENSFNIDLSSSALH